MMAALVTAAFCTATGASAGDSCYDNPYRSVPGWGALPEGREWGATSAIYPAADGNVWVAERCGANSCVGMEDVNPILLFDAEGGLLREFGAGLFVWPHGMHVDPDGNLWVTDARGEDGRGHQVHKLSPDGELLMSLGKAGVAGDGADEFDGPSDVLVAPDGSIFVADGHGSEGNNRIVKLDREGNFIKSWGTTGREDGEFRDPHALAMDAAGRLFVGDRGNSRIQIFDQDGEHLATWTQFGRPSGLFIADGVLYATDSESNATVNPGWHRGIYIGSIDTGFVTAFIPDPEPDPDNVPGFTSAAEGVAVDADGNVYGAEVGPRQVVKHLPTPRQ
jgi:DNA-binding beta-propeller fold protein YncE